MIEVEPTHQHWQLVAHVKGVLHRKMIAESMENGPKGSVRFPVIGPIEFLHQLFKPQVGALYRQIEDVKASEFHALEACTCDAAFKILHAEEEETRCGCVPETRTRNSSTFACPWRMLRHDALQVW